MYRRTFIHGILAAAVAPVFIKADILMPVKKVWRPPWMEMEARETIGYDMLTDSYLLRLDIETADRMQMFNIDFRVNPSSDEEIVKARNDGFMRLFEHARDRGIDYRDLRPSPIYHALGQYQKIVRYS